MLRLRRFVFQSLEIEAEIAKEIKNNEPSRRNLLILIKKKRGLGERTAELGTIDFKIKQQIKRNVPNSEFPIIQTSI